GGVVVFSRHFRTAEVFLSASEVNGRLCARIHRVSLAARPLAAPRIKSMPILVDSKSGEGAIPLFSETVESLFASIVSTRQSEAKSRAITPVFHRTGRACQILSIWCGRWRAKSPRRLARV